MQKIKELLKKNVAPALLSGVLHALSFPNELWGQQGLGFLALVALVPVLYSVFTSSRKQALLSGFIYGSVAYALFSTFYAGTSATGLYFTLVFGHGLGYALLFFAFSWINTRLPKTGLLVMALLHTAYGFLFVSKWWLAVSYGFLPYALYKYPLLTQFCDLVGVTGLLFTMTLTQASAALVLKEHSWKAFRKPAMIASVVIVVFQVVYGAISLGIWSKTGADKELEIGIIQPACGDFDEEYGTLEGWEFLKKQIIEVSEKKPDLIISAETSFTYPISWFEKYPVNRFAKISEIGPIQYSDILSQQKAVSELLALQNEIGIPILLGNADIDLDGDVDPYPDGWDSEYMEQNKVVLIEGGKVTSSYTKVHLAPMWETFPLANTTSMKNFYKSKGIELYTAGTETNPLLFDGLKIGTPICFEGHFPYICSGYDCDLFISPGSNSYDQDGIGQLNDAIISSFRAIENRRTYIRVFNTGMSCMFNPMGEIVERLPQHERTTAVWDVEIYNSCTTLYSRCPNLLGWLSALISFGVLVYLFITRKKERNG